MKDDLAHAVVAMALHAGVCKMKSPAFEVGSGRRCRGGDHRHDRDGRGGLADLFVCQGQGNDPHLLPGEILGMESALPAPELSQLLLAIPGWQSGDRGAKKFLFPLPFYPVTGGADLAVDYGSGDGDRLGR